MAILTVQDIRELYDKGQCEEALRAITTALSTQPSEETRRALVALTAWCHYRLRRYDEAMRAAQSAPDEEWAKECLAQTYAYGPGHENDPELFRLAVEFPENVGIQNAFVIRARHAKSTITHEEVLQVVGRVQGASEKMGHVRHNAARFFLDKARTVADYALALQFINGALEWYGESTAHHHRAAAWFWKSQILSKLGKTDDAVKAAEESLRHWDAQIALAPENADFRAKRESAASWLKSIRSSA
jgi:tetratricopeptide (TPR) repeat protein